MSFEFVSRDEWGARAPRSVRAVAPDQFTAVEVHHSATPVREALAAVRGFQNFHMDTNGWRDLFYNWLVHPDGTILEGRSWVTSPRPENVMTVCLIGNYDAIEMTAAQEQSVKEIVWESQRRMPQLVGRDVKWHNQRAATACPGTDAVAFVRQQNSLGWPVPPPPAPNVSSARTQGVGAPEIGELDILRESAFATSFTANETLERAEWLSGRIKALEEQTEVLADKAQTHLTQVRAFRPVSYTHLTLPTIYSV